MVSTLAWLYWDPSLVTWQEGDIFANSFRQKSHHPRKAAPTAALPLSPSGRMACRPSWNLPCWRRCCSETGRHSPKLWSWGRWLWFSVFLLRPKLHSCTVEAEIHINIKKYRISFLRFAAMYVTFLTFSLVAWQLRSGESMKPRPKTRTLRQSNARMSHNPLFSKSVNSTGWPE